MEETKNIYVRNQRGIRVKQCCASCALKDYKPDGKRICTQNGEKVEAQDVCNQWQLSEGLKNAGRKSGVVRDMVTKEVIIH